MRRGVGQNRKTQPSFLLTSVHVCVCVCHSWHSHSIAWLVDGTSKYVLVLLLTESFWTKRIVWYPCRNESFYKGHARMSSGGRRRGGRGVGMTLSVV